MSRLRLAGIGQVFLRCGGVMRFDLMSAFVPLLTISWLISLVAAAGGGKAEDVLACGQLCAARLN